MILVVEDDEGTRCVLLRLIERLGYEATGVADGAAALQFLREQPRPNLIVLDQGLPYVDGLSVLRSLRADARHHATPIIMYTAAALPSVADAAFHAGVAQVLTKSGDWLPLLAAVRRHAGPSQS